MKPPIVSAATAELESPVPIKPTHRMNRIYRQEALITNSTNLRFFIDPLDDSIEERIG